MSTNTNKVTLEAAYKALYSKVQTDYPPSATFEILGQVFTRDQFLAKIKARIDAFDTSAAKKADWRSAVGAERVINAEVSPLRTAFRGILVMKFGKDNPKLLDYGYTPAKTPKKTSASKTVGAVKAKATRQARHTMSKKQKKGIKGAVALTPQELETVVTNGPAPAASATPAGNGGALAAPPTPAAPAPTPPAPMAKPSLSNRT